MLRRSARPVVACLRHHPVSATASLRTWPYSGLSNERMPTHPKRHWQDWANYGLALWLAVSPWLADYAAHDAATANAAVGGLALAVIAHFGGTCEHMSCE